ncbi:hypothetical protein P691DRAFT_690117 [Macrolepiota fuliginosa MF-IS2]|uniref:Uncharacterized protein n=1 Tax=Macrolepiota fuliginosa MF-IS2 TaxID=1400762 RepID=A0A9P5WYJ0_9AGAR|nr:hypothetical protein P691DRAFT_690117 [Macrolepiota fuliginosa MF-IS2]
MILDFVSADYGWLPALDGLEMSHVLFKPGKNCDSYFINDNILVQVEKAMDILKNYYLQDKHIFIFDKATTHKKWLATAPSA